MENNDNNKGDKIQARAIIIAALIGLLVPIVARIINEIKIGIPPSVSSGTESSPPIVSTVPDNTTTDILTTSQPNKETSNSDTTNKIFTLKSENGDITVFSDNDCIANINENYITSHPLGSISESGLEVSGWYIQLYNNEFSLDVYVQCFINNKNEIKVQETKIAINNMVLDHEFQTANCIYSNNHATIFFDGNKLPINIREATGIMIGVWHQEG